MSALALIDWLFGTLLLMAFIWLIKRVKAGPRAGNTADRPIESDERFRTVD